MLHSGTLSMAAPPSAAAVMARSLGCIYPLARQSASSSIVDADSTEQCSEHRCQERHQVLVRGLLRLPG